MELDQLRDPQRLAVAAKKLGMVAPAQPAFIRLSDGRVLGTPAKATPADTVRITPLPSAKPRSINPKPLVIRVPRRRPPRYCRGCFGQHRRCVHGRDGSRR